ncbi:MAG: hypothetical protein ACHQFZ_01605 [Acidimicrobiales bacterium]
MTEMLVNMLGIEGGDEAPVGRAPRLDPKSRDTLTTLVGALLASFATSGPPPSPTRLMIGVPADVRDIGSTGGPVDQESHRDAA